MQKLETSDYRGTQWPGFNPEEEEEGYPLYVFLIYPCVGGISADCFDSPLVMKVRSRTGSVMSGASTPGTNIQSKNLSERDLQRADEALSNGVNGATK